MNRLLQANAALIALALFATSAAAQRTITPERVPGPVRNAGTYHVASGTWSRATSTAALGPDVIYRNDAASGYFTTANVGRENTDEGHVPTTASPWSADRDVYEVNCFEVGYCSESAGVEHTYNFYDSYLPCADVSDQVHCLNTVATYVITGMPAGVSATTCWTVTVDLTGMEFCLEGDGGPCNPGYDGDPDLDSFGWGATLGSFGDGTGPLVSGDPDWTYVTPGAAIGGGGTYYDTVQSGCQSETGLNTQDLFYAVWPGAIAPTCYWFGGYLNTNGCGGPQNNPFASFHLVLYAADELPCTPNVRLACEPANGHSSGGPATLTASALDENGALHLDCADGPPMQFGYFLVSETLVEPGLALADGSLCLGAPLGRYSPVAGGALNSAGQFSAAGRFRNLSGTSSHPEEFGFDVPVNLPGPPGGVINAGETFHFQCWFRDGQSSNLSDAATVTFP